jgi:hypothetical protein
MTGLATKPSVRGVTVAPLRTAVVAPPRAGVTTLQHNEYAGGLLQQQREPVNATRFPVEPLW